MFPQLHKLLISSWPTGGVLNLGIVVDLPYKPAPECEGGDNRLPCRKNQSVMSKESLPSDSKQNIRDHEQTEMGGRH